MVRLMDLKGLMLALLFLWITIVCASGPEPDDSQSASELLSKVLKRVQELEKEVESLRQERDHMGAMVDRTRCDANSHDPVPPITVDPQSRLIGDLARNYSSLHCIGPASSKAIQSRQGHPVENMDEDQLLAGIETNIGGGCNQRVCHVKNACLRSFSPGIILHVDPHNPELEAQFIKVEHGDATGPRLVRLQTQADGLIPMGAFEIRREPISTAVDVVWHEGVFSYFQAFGPDSLGHVLFDALFPSFMAFRMFGFDHDSNTLNLVMGSTCGLQTCKRFFYDWGRGIADKVIERPNLQSNQLYCFDNLLVGVGQFSSGGGFNFWKNSGKSAMFRDFHQLFLRRLRLTVGPEGKKTQDHRVLIVDKKDPGWNSRRVTNFQEIQIAISSNLGLETDITPGGFHLLPCREQISMTHDYTVLVSTIGGGSFGLFFARPGTSIIFIAHVVWEDLFWNNVGFLNDIYYIAEDSETLQHERLSSHEQWNADMKIDPANLLPLVLRAAQQQERWQEMYQSAQKTSVP